MKSKLKKSLSLLLALVMAMSCMSLGAFADDNVAKVGDTEYATIEEAVAAWTSGTTLTLLADVTVSQTVRVDASRNTPQTLKLGDHVWTASGCDAFQLYSDENTANNGGFKVYANASGGVKADKNCFSYDKATCANRPVLNIYGGTYSAGPSSGWFSSNYVITNNGTAGPGLYLKVSTTDGTEPVLDGPINLYRVKTFWYAGKLTGVYNWGFHSTYNTVIYEGKFRKQGVTMSADSNGKFKYDESSTGFYNEEGYYVIAKGIPVEYEAKVTNTTLNNYSGTYLYYEKANTAISEMKSSNSPLIISAGITATQDKSISSGTYTIDATAEGAAYTGNVTLTGTSGTFVIKFPESVGYYGAVKASKSGYHVALSETTENGIVTRTYTVKQDVSTQGDAEAKIGNVYYDTVYDAFYAVDGNTEDKTIVLLKDVTNASIITNGKAVNEEGTTEVTFDLNGHSFTLQSAGTGNQADYTLTVIDSSEEKTGVVTNNTWSLLKLALSGDNDFSGTYKVIVKGGTWHLDPSNVSYGDETYNLVAKGYTVKDNDNGTWTVGAAPIASSDDGNNEYNTVEEVIAAVGGDTEITVNTETTIAGVDVAAGSTVTAVTETPVTNDAATVTPKTLTIAKENEDDKTVKAYVVSSGEGANEKKAVVTDVKVADESGITNEDPVVEDLVKVAQVLANAVAEKSIDVSSITSMTLRLDQTSNTASTGLTKDTVESGAPETVKNQLIAKLDDNSVKVYDVKPIATVTTTTTGETTTTQSYEYDASKEVTGSFTFKLNVGTSADAGKTANLTHYHEEGGVWTATKLSGIVDSNGDVEITLNQFSYITVDSVTATDFATIVANAQSGDVIELTEDLNLGEWTPIAFSGITLNGNGHTITYTLSHEVTDKNEEYLGGLFSTVSGDSVFKDLTINATITETGGPSEESIYGGLYAKAASDCTSVLIQNVTVKGSISATKYAAGVVGQHRYGSLSFDNVTNEANVSGAKYAAGILGGGGGSQPYAALSFDTCVNKGNITATKWAGAICANLNRPTTNEIVTGANYTYTNCSNTGTVSGTSASAMVYQEQGGEFPTSGYSPIRGVVYLANKLSSVYFNNVDLDGNRVASMKVKTFNMSADKHFVNNSYAADSVKVEWFPAGTAESAMSADYVCYIAVDGSYLAFDSVIGAEMACLNSGVGHTIVLLKDCTEDVPTFLSTPYEGNSTYYQSWRSMSLVVTLDKNGFAYDKGEFVYTPSNTTVFAVINSVVAKIGDAKYETLAAAVEAATAGDTIVLYDDVALDSTVVINKNLTIDLNGHTITADNCRALWIKNGDVTITGSGTVSAGTANSTFDNSSSVIRVGDSAANTNKAMLTIGENVTVSSPYCYGITAFGNNDADNDKTTADIKLVVNGTVSVSGVQAAVSGNGTNTLSATTMTINGTVTAANEYAIYHPGKGELTVNGTVSGLGGIEIKSGALTVGEYANITATATEQSHITNNNGTSTSGYAIAAVGNSAYVGDPTVTINGGSTISGTAITLAENNSENYGTITATSSDINIPDGYEWVTANGVSTLKKTFEPVATVVSSWKDVAWVYQENMDLLSSTIFNIYMYVPENMRAGAYVVITCGNANATSSADANDGSRTLLLSSLSINNDTYYVIPQTLFAAEYGKTITVKLYNNEGEQQALYTNYQNKNGVKTVDTLEYNTYSTTAYAYLARLAAKYGEGHAWTELANAMTSFGQKAEIAFEARKNDTID